MRHILCGAVAGAAGTVALDTATYLDMAIRGRAPSQMTRLLAQKLAALGGIEPLAQAEPDDSTKNRQTALGSILGYANGIGVGLLYGALKPRLPKATPLWLTAVLAGALAMALTDVTASALGATDPATWKREDWLADALPHLAFGLQTALAFETIAAT
jgi:hypothetical protein